VDGINSKALRSNLKRNCNGLYDGSRDRALKPASALTSRINRRRFCLATTHLMCHYGLGRPAVVYFSLSALHEALHAPLTIHIHSNWSVLSLDFRDLINHL
jgi:hypothetical protein